MFCHLETTVGNTEGWYWFLGQEREPHPLHSIGYQNNSLNRIFTQTVFSNEFPEQFNVFNNIFFVTQ